ncbi:MAG: urease accessory protein UreE [Granulosicoccus sp.]
MITCHQIERANPESIELDGIIDTVTLDETDRHRRRLMLTSDSGIEFLLELESVTLLKNNDVLRLNDGRGIRVQALPEALYEIHGNDPRHLLTLTWHVGNRHLASEIMQEHVRIRRDPVIRRMLEQLGATVVEIQAGFNPEGGAYGDAHSSHRHHSHSHD